MSETEPIEAEFEACQAAQRRRRIFVAAVVGLVVLALLVWLLAPRVRSCIGFVHSAEERAAIDQAIRERRALADRLDAELDQALATLSGLEARPDLGGCPIRLARPRDQAQGLGASILPEGSPERMDEGTSLEEIAAQRSAGARAVDENVAILVRDRDRRFGSDRWREDSFRHTVVDFTPPSRQVVFVRRAGPAVEDSLHSSATELGGDAYVYDISARRFVCAATVRALPSDEIRYLHHVGDPASDRASLQSALAGDLRRQLYRQIADRVVPLGPRP